jgi:hypothetical protein
VLLPPLAVMAAFGLLTMKRGAINAIDWFSVMALTCAPRDLDVLVRQADGLAAARPRTRSNWCPASSPNWAGRLLRRAGRHRGWFVLVHWRISRQPAVLWRAVVLSSGGLILIWICS